MNPLDLTGPEFLTFWLVGAVGVAMATMASIAVIARLGGSGFAEPIAAGLSPIELAYLEAGHERAIDTALVRLHQRGALVVAQGVLGIGEPVADVAPLEARLLAAVRSGTRAPSQLVRDTPDELRARFIREGLLLRPRHTGVRLLAYAWLGLGAAKVVVGLSRHRPVGFLVMLLLLGACLVPLIKLPRRTHLGTRVLAMRREGTWGLQISAQTAPALLSADELALAVALFGTGGLALPIVGLLPSHARAVALASADSTCSCSSGGNCGGGCGGGCGGCS